MTTRYRSGRRFTDPDNVPQGPVLDYLNDLVRTLYDLESDVPYLPINKESFVINTSVERYTVSAASTLPELAQVVGTLLTKFKDSGIIK